MKLKVGDKVKVIAGKEKGKEGQIILIDRVKNTVVVDELNIATKHVKPSQANPDGRIAKIARPIHASNVAYLDGSEKSKLAYKKENGKTVRVAKKSGKVIK